jgi:hypothetical protein
MQRLSPPYAWQGYYENTILCGVFHDCAQRQCDVYHSNTSGYVPACAKGNPHTQKTIASLKSTDSGWGFQARQHSMQAQRQPDTQSDMPQLIALIKIAQFMRDKLSTTIAPTLEPHQLLHGVFMAPA